MKIRITLAKIRNTNVFHPFWFTTDRLIHLNAESPTREIELDELSLNHIVQINNAGIKGIISISDTKALQEALSKKDPNAEGAPVVPHVEYPIDKDAKEAKEEKTEEVNPKLEEAKELISKSVKQLKKTVGSKALNENGELQPGIVDIELLKAAIMLEEEKEEPRKSVVSILKDRLEAISESNGFVADEEELEEITPDNLIKQANK